MNDDVNGCLVDNNEQNRSVDAVRSEGATNRSEWISPQLKEFGNLSFVVKGISYNPSDGLTNLTP
ncbi:MAG TPA: hypothetical protein VFC63_27610 [Blastocatellia bacterium]|nr:hypothetical protein [Blastocatellia bacterium]